VRTASAKVKVPAATCAEYSPREWPAANAGAMPRDLSSGSRTRKGVLGELEVVFGAFEDDLRERELERVVGFLEDGAGGGEGVVEGAAHAYGLRALAGEEECELDCGSGISHQG